jgi:hypothetical protein
VKINFKTSPETWRKNTNKKIHPSIFSETMPGDFRPSIRPSITIGHLVFNFLNELMVIDDSGGQSRNPRRLY